MLSAGLGPITFLIVVNVLLLIGGQFMEPSGLLIIVAPLVFPIAIALGIDPIHLGIMMVVNMEIGMITPPVGLNVFVIKSVVPESITLTTIFKGVLVFLFADLVVVLLLMLFPEIVLFLPNLME